MTILVTGATGTVGRQVIRQLARRGADIRALVRDPAKADLPAGVAVATGDFLDVDAMRAALSGVSKYVARVKCAMLAWVALEDDLTRA